MHSHISCTHIGNGFSVQFDISRIIRANNGVFAYYGHENLSRRDMNIFLSDFVRNSEKRKRVKIKVC